MKYIRMKDRRITIKTLKLSSIHPLFYIIVLILITPIYSVLNQIVADAVDVVTVVDTWIPFVKEFIIPYLLWYPFIYGALVYFCFVDRKQYFIALSSVIVGKIICFIIYFFWQTTVPRPIVTGEDVFSNLVRFVYSMDQPVNCLPSIHVLTTFIMMIVVYKRKEQHIWEYRIVNTMGILIILSTMFTKQHAILDVIAGIAVAIAVYVSMQAVFSEKKFFQLSLFKAREIKKVR